MQNINLNKIKYDFNYLKKHYTFDQLIKLPKMNTLNSYSNSYNEFLLYFQNIDQINKHNLIIAAHAIYGWMPTILKKFNYKNCDKAVLILNRVKKNESINKQDLELLKNTLNNSIVGVSKLLHFINPKMYPIWDSRVCNYLVGQDYGYVVNNTSNYMKYLKGMNKIKEHKEFDLVCNNIQKYIDNTMDPMRTIELFMFIYDKTFNN